MDKINDREKEQSHYPDEEYRDHGSFFMSQKEMNQYANASIVIGAIFWAAVIVLFSLVGSCNSAHAEEIKEAMAVRALIGEASNQGYDGMLAVACAIRNRGTLKGVYGVKSKHIDKEPKWVWEQARKAWSESAKHDVTHGATHWENVKAFGDPYWKKSMTLTYKIKDHEFYRESRQSRWVYDETQNTLTPKTELVKAGAR